MILFGQDLLVADWVSQEIFGTPGMFDNSRALGVLLDGELIAGVVYNNMHTSPDGSPYTIEMSVASTDKRWCSRRNLKAFFSYPFIQLGLKRVQTHCRADDQAVIEFNKRLGFMKEGYHRELWPLGGDSISWSMLKHECRYINGKIES